MSASEVAKLLGVSRRTLMRWVNQSGIELEKNELGHYQFSNEDVENLKQILEQANNQSHHEPSETSQTIRKGTLTTVSAMDNSKVEALNERVDRLERTLRSKADDVVSYQLLQHRREMEEMIKKIDSLEKKVEELEAAQENREHKKEQMLVFDQSPSQKKPRRKSLISSIFSF